MYNEDVEIGRDYHHLTKHSPKSVRRSAHFLDWSNQPLPFKIYSRLEALPLPHPAEPTQAPALSAIAVDIVGPVRSIPGRDDLVRLLHFSAGITRRRTYPGGEILFRAAACTGALYEIELYLVCGPLPDLPAGVYHFSPTEMALRILRQGDYRGVLVAASGQEPFLAHAPAIVISTGTYWRNAWKYQSRTYRHLGWDNGTIFANALALASSLGLPAKLVCGFVDDRVNYLLGLDSDREAALALLGLGQQAAPSHERMEGIPLLNYETVPLSREQIDYPAIRQMHHASSLQTAENAAAWRKLAPAVVALPPTGEPTPLQPLPEKDIPRDTIEEVVMRRGSSRHFRREPTNFAHLSTILSRSTEGIPADFRAENRDHLNDLYLIVHAVDGLRPGAYFYSVERRRLEGLKYGDFRRQAAFLALDQALAGDAAVAVFFLADLNRWMGWFGNRGYRAVQLEAGILGGKMYLAAYALGLGATGLTFYDDEVVDFFSPHAAGSGAIFLVALGHPARQQR